MIAGCAPLLLPFAPSPRFRGIGSATCTHDGAPLVNAPNGKCAPPLTLTAKDFGGADTRHEVEVTFTDVCGRVRTAAYE